MAVFFVGLINLTLIDQRDFYRGGVTERWEGKRWFAAGIEPVWSMIQFNAPNHKANATPLEHLRAHSLKDEELRVFCIFIVSVRSGP